MGVKRECARSRGTYNKGARHADGKVLRGLPETLCNDRSRSAYDERVR